MTNKPVKVVIPPEVLTMLEQDMEPDELQSFLDKLKEMAESGELFEESQLVDMETLQREDPSLYQHLVEIVDDLGEADSDFDPKNLN